MSTGVNCTVLVDGQRAADGSPGDNLLDPIVLDDLTVTWGRSDTMSQPPPDTCSFTVMDQLGGQAFMATYVTGHRIDIMATGLTYPDPTVPTFQNGGFETALVTWAPTAGTATRSTARFHGGAYALAVKPAGNAGSVLLGPGEFQPPGTNPGAWDAIPTTANGQTWAASLAVRLPAGAVATVRGVLFTGPYAASAQRTSVAQTVVGTGAWQTVTGQYLVQRDFAWVGLEVTLDPTGPTWDEMPPALTWNAVDPTLTWDDLGTLYIDDVSVTAPAGALGRSVLVFAGRITDLSAAWDDSTDSPVVQVTASGFTADLDNRTVGDEPWTVETVDARAHRILTLAGLPIDIDIDTSIDTLLLSYRDVDAQGATGLLQQIATSVDGVLWPAVHQTLGAYLRLEDPSLRASLLKLHEDAGTIVIVQADPSSGIDLSACVVLRDPVTWLQSVSDVVTRVAVGWKVQGVDDTGLPMITDATVQQVDGPLEVLYGTRRVSVSTELQAAEDATEVAARILARTSPADWRAEGLTIDDEDVLPDEAGVAMMLNLLDGTSRIGAPVVLNDLPGWSPGGTVAGVYLEGGTYRFVGGRWVLELLVSAAAGLGQSAQWDQLGPTWTWNQWEPSLTWNDLRGVAAP